MKSTDVIIIGGGQAGLAMSRKLARRDIAHVVLERGRIGERWRRGSWVSLRLLTPASYSALPDLGHNNLSPDAFMSAEAFTQYLDTYASTFDLPIVEDCCVTRVARDDHGYLTQSAGGTWRSRAVVIATGACDVPSRPAMSASLSPTIEQIVPQDYVSPGRLAPGRVLIVGASATGLQLAEEIHASGRPVTLAVGSHTRMPRRYRNLDIFEAMDKAGILDDPAATIDDIDGARRQPSTQLVGRDDQRDIDLPILQRQGVRIVGRLSGLDGARACFDDSLARTTSASDQRMYRTLQRIDAALVARADCATDHDHIGIEPARLASEWSVLDLVAAGIRTVVWATGYVRRYDWLDVPVLDRNGEVAHVGGVTAAAGLYIIGQKFMRRRRSHFIDGCGYDAEDLSAMIATHLESSAAQHRCGFATRTRIEALP